MIRGTKGIYLMAAMIDMPYAAPVTPSRVLRLVNGKPIPPSRWVVYLPDGFPAYKTDDRAEAISAARRLSKTWGQGVTVHGLR